MLVIVGFVVVLGAIVGGYLMEHGKLLVLMQPAELVIIGGAAGSQALTSRAASQPATASRPPDPYQDHIARASSSARRPAKDQSTNQRLSSVRRMTAGGTGPLSTR